MTLSGVFYHYYLADINQITKKKFTMVLTRLE